MQLARHCLSFQITVLMNQAINSDSQLNQTINSDSQLNQAINSGSQLNQAINSDSQLNQVPNSDSQLRTCLIPPSPQPHLDQSNLIDEVYRSQTPKFFLSVRRCACIISENTHLAVEQLQVYGELHFGPNGPSVLCPFKSKLQSDFRNACGVLVGKSEV
jgi:hypothetical protein